MSLKISCLSIDCPERTGGICRYDPRRQRVSGYKLNAYQQAWSMVEDIIEVYGDDTESCVALLNEYVNAALHGRKDHGSE